MHWFSIVLFSPVLNELLSRQLQLVKKAVREVQYFARSNAWLSEINRFVRTWKESDLKNLKRTPVELQKVCYKINSWMTAVSKLSPIVSSTCHIVSVDCEPLKSGLISQLQPIMQQLMKGAREELDRVYLLVNSKVVEWFQVMLHLLLGFVLPTYYVYLFLVLSFSHSVVFLLLVSFLPFFFGLLISFCLILFLFACQFVRYLSVYLYISSSCLSVCVLLCLCVTLYFCLVVCFCLFPCIDNYLFFVYMTVYIFVCLTNCLYYVYRVFKFPTSTPLT